MAISQARSKRSPTGAKYKAFRKKKQFELGREPTLTGLGARRLRRIRVMGGNSKYALLSCDIANVQDQKSGKCFKAKIKTITENPANRHYVRRNIITKGTIILTDKGKAKVTSRPGQEGTINAVLLHE